MARIERPFYPIIYVRGYAMTQDEIVQTTSTPFMGFEAGSTKIRQAHDGSIRGETRPTGGARFTLSWKAQQ